MTQDDYYLLQDVLSALKDSTSLENLGHNIALAKGIKGPDESGITLEEYEQAADDIKIKIESAIAKTRYLLSEYYPEPPTIKGRFSAFLGRLLAF